VWALERAFHIDFALRTGLLKDDLATQQERNNWRLGRGLGSWFMRTKAVAIVIVGHTAASCAAVAAVHVLLKKQKGTPAAARHDYRVSLGFFSSLT